MQPTERPQSPRHCPALLIGASASGQGKTTVTAALAHGHRRAGRRVRVFKIGPDFLDPTLLAEASGAPVQQLDLFMGGEAHCRALLYEAAAEADVILVEGVMGLYDGEPGHTFHHSESDYPVAQYSQPQRASGRGEAVYRRGRTLATYMHSYWPSNPEAVAALFHPQSPCYEATL